MKATWGLLGLALIPAWTAPGDPDDTAQHILLLNSKVGPVLHSLLKTTYFRYVKLDLKRDCPFWNNTLVCEGANCSVGAWKNFSLEETKFQFLEKESALLDDQTDFALLEDQNSRSGVYIDLIENPERFTGYSGQSAQMVWAALYSEFSHGCDASHTLDEEERAFSQVISGLHSSVSVHLSYRYLNQTTGLFGPNATLYRDRVGVYPDRLANFYYAYKLLVRALQKAGPYLASLELDAGSMYENQKTRDLMRKLVSLSVTCPNLFNEKSLFVGEGSRQLRQRFQCHFRNVSRIMDCVDCQNCRVWGKIQTMGIGTALKILYSYNWVECTSSGSCSISQPSTFPIVERDFDYRLSKIEIVSLINTLGRFSDSAEYVRRFEALGTRQSVNYPLYSVPVIVGLSAAAVWWRSRGR